MGRPNQRVHLCFVSPEAFPILANSDLRRSFGGAAIHQTLLAKAFRKRGFRVSVVVNDYGQKNREVYDGIEVVTCELRHHLRKFSYFCIDTLRLICTLRRVNADIYFLMNPRTLMFTLAINKWLSGRKIVNLVGEDVACTKDRKGFPELLYDWGLRWVDYTIFQSNFQKRCAERFLGLRGEVIRNPAHAWHSNSPPSTRDIDVLWIGLCAETKHPHYLLDIALAMDKVNFTMIATPTSDEEAYRSVRIRAQSLANVTHLRCVQYKEIWRYYKRAKVFAFTSSREGFPNVFLQAWQAAAPVVSLGCDPDGIIRDHKLGLVSGDICQMKKHIYLLLHNDELRAEYGKNGMDYVKRNHNMDDICRSYMAVFDRLLER